jgi:hypothetical protein
MVEMIAKQWLTMNPGLVKSMFSDAFMAEGLPKLQANPESGEDADAFHEIDILELLCQAFEYLVFFIDEKKQAIVNMAKEKVSLIIDVHDGWQQYATDRDNHAALNAWIKAWAKCQGIAPLPQHISHAQCLANTFSLMDRLDNHAQLEKMIIRFLIDVLGPGSSTNQALAREASNKSGLLPSMASTIVEMALDLDRLGTTATANRDGKDLGGLLEVSLLMSSIGTVKEHGMELIALRASFDEDYKSVFAEWEVLFAAHLEKCKCHADCNAFLKKYSNLWPAVESWSFEDCPWVSADSTAADNVMAKRVEQIITQLTTWKSVLNRMQTKIAWMTSPHQTQLQVALDEVMKVEEKVDDVRKTFAVLMLVSCLVKAEKANGTSATDGVDVASCIKYVTRVLCFNLKELPSNVLSRLSGGEQVPNLGGKASQTAKPSSVAGKVLKKLTKR